MKKTISISMMLMFFIAMFIFTLTARTIHNSQIPNVTAARLTYEDFEIEYTLESGQVMTSMQKRLAIPQSVYDKGDVYIITTIHINGEERTAVQKVHLEIGNENNEFYEVVNGLTGLEIVVINSDKELITGNEVYIRNK